MSKTPKLWKHAERIVEQCRSGKRLCRFNRRTKTGDIEIVFFLEPGGKQVGRRSAENAIAAGGLIAAQDGLFAETSQTWGLQ